MTSRGAKEITWLFFILTLGNFFIFWFTDPPSFLFFSKWKKKKFIIFYRLFIIILSSDVTVLACLILKQGVQGLQAFSFCMLTINDEHTKQT